MIYLLILIFGAALSFFGPWWIIAPTAWIICRWKATSSKEAFIQSSLAVASLWLSYALFIYFSSNQDFITRIAGVFTSSSEGAGPIGSPALVFGICAFIATLIGGLSGFAGYRLKNIGS